MTPGTDQNFSNGLLDSKGQWALAKKGGGKWTRGHSGGDKKKAATVERLMIKQGEYRKRVKMEKGQYLIKREKKGL